MPMETFLGAISLCSLVLIAVTHSKPTAIAKQPLPVMTTLSSPIGSENRTLIDSDYLASLNFSAPFLRLNKNLNYIRYSLKIKLNLGQPESRKIPPFVFTLILAAVSLMVKAY